MRLRNPRQVVERLTGCVLQGHQEQPSVAVDSGELTPGPAAERAVLVEQHDQTILGNGHVADGTLGPVPVRKRAPSRSRLRHSDRAVRRLRAALLDWFDSNGRALAFRASASAYGILVGEVMAQQTQVSRVEPAWRAFMSRYPTAASLAGAPVADVLRGWAGLGYNRRALNLQRAAVRIVRDHGGGVPADVAELERLPGVGPYTARAVAAVAFGVPVGAVDTNVRRVLTRVLSAPVGAAASAVDVQRTADDLVDPTRPADWTHALMDVGATICRPARVECDRCPLRPWCASAQSFAVSQSRPVPRPHRVPRRTNAAPFPTTSRWLRGRLVAQLVAAPNGAWQTLDGPLGAHSAAQVEQALTALARESLVERDDAGRVRLPPGGHALAAIVRP
jgi:A/G-specific adenine glycosylase